MSVRRRMWIGTPRTIWVIRWLTLALIMSWRRWLYRRELSDTILVVKENSVFMFVQQVFDVGNGPPGIEVLRTGACAIHDRMAAIQLECIIEIFEPLFCHLISRVYDPSIGLLQDYWSVSKEDYPWDPSTYPSSTNTMGRMLSSNYKECTHTSHRVWHVPAVIASSQSSNLDYQVVSSVTKALWSCIVHSCLFDLLTRAQNAYLSPNP